MKKTLLFIFTALGFFQPLLAGIHQDVDKLILDRKFDQAEKMALEYTEKHPDDNDGLCALACTYRNKSYKERININLAALGLKEGETGTVTLTSNMIDKAFSNSVTYDAALFAKAEELYYKIIARDKKYINAYFNLLNFYEEMGEFDRYFKVVDMLVAGITEADGLRDCVAQLAGKLVEHEEFGEAEKLFDAALGKNPGIAEFVSDKGAVLCMAGRYAEGLKCFESADKSVPKDMMNLENLSNAYVMTENFPKAYDTAVRITALDRTNSIYYFVSGTLAYLVGKEYVPFFKKFMEIGEKEKKQEDLKKDAYYIMAGQFLHIKELEAKNRTELLEGAAIDYFQGKARFDAVIMANLALKEGGSGSMLVVLGGVYDAARYNSKAIKYLDRIREYNIKNSPVMDGYNLTANYGSNYYKMGEYDKALEEYARLVAQNKDDVPANYMMGRCYLCKRDKENARKYLEVAAKGTKKEELEYAEWAAKCLKELK
jgi:tetratricopeptide (TPR) repeat protein